MKLAAIAQEPADDEQEHRTERTCFCPDEPLSMDEVGFTSLAVASMIPTPSPWPLCGGRDRNLCDRLWEARFQSFGSSAEMVRATTTLEHGDGYQEFDTGRCVYDGEPLCAEDIASGTPIGFPIATPTPFLQYPSDFMRLRWKDYTVAVQ